MNEQAQAVGLAIFGLAALLGVVAAMVGLFVLRTEHVEGMRRVGELERWRTTELERRNDEPN